MSDSPTNNIKSCLDWTARILKEKMPELKKDDQLHVEITDTINSYLLKHGRGALLVVYSGSVYPESLTRGSSLHLKRDFAISVGILVRYFSNRMLPAEYVDWVTEKLSGFEVISHRPKNERLTQPVKDDLVSEENGLWQFLVTIKIPAEFISTENLES